MFTRYLVPIQIESFLVVVDVYTFKYTTFILFKIVLTTNKNSQKN